jgi:hypothetical protein
VLCCSRAFSWGHAAGYHSCPFRPRETARRSTCRRTMRAAALAAIGARRSCRPQRLARVVAVW